ncbi:MAG: ATP-binding cassette domain-containing protein [Deltaproteobacteria bacterium]|nr:ATP-binding cassette domain-containing protein [Deltaproteobacteria bacterium]
MALLSLSDLSVAFDDVPLLNRISLNVERGERVCLVGRNGTGKSTLMKTIIGSFSPDSGEIARERGAVFSYLPQDVPVELHGTVFDEVAGGLEAKGKLLAEYHDVSMSIAKKADAGLMGRLEKIQSEIELAGGWQLHNEVERVISHMQLGSDDRCEELSAGMKRRVLLAKALVAKPDLLMLDEPTNHLDISTIRWLEEYLQNYKGTLLFVTHDRMFLRKLATRIVELDRGILHSWACNYDTYLKRRESDLAAEEKKRAEFARKLASEEAWLRKGVRARRTRNEGRVKALKRMREFKRSLRQRMGSIHLEAQEIERSGKLVIEIENASFNYGDNHIVRDFSSTVMRGDKIGVIGPNGSGKTTLLRMLLDELPLSEGTLRHGTNLKIAYFDQLRDALDEEMTLQDNICDGNPLVTVGGKQRHILSYLQDFLFPPERSRSPVKVLSGGERNRLMLAKLFTLPSNVLVLDEPTNDLDADTLDLLEDMLVQYEGTVLLVSHDREFLNNVVTSTVVFEGDAKVAEYVGGYDDWLRQRKDDPIPESQSHDERKRKKEKRAETGARKLSFKEKRELSELPVRIESLESERKELFDSMSDPKVYESAGGVTNAQKRLDRIEVELKAAYDMWAELEERS